MSRNLFFVCFVFTFFSSFSQQNIPYTIKWFENGFEESNHIHFPSDGTFVSLEEDCYVKFSSSIENFQRNK